MRAIRREEAFIEKQLAAALGAEVLQLTASVSEELRRVEETLALGAPASVPGGFAAWKKGTPLVGVPFLLTSSYGLDWPRGSQGAAEREFLRRHGEFLSGRQQSPVYTNIALAFQDQILPPAEEAGQAQEAEAAGTEAVGAAQTADSARQAESRAELSAEVQPRGAAREPAEKAARAEAAQQAVSAFESDREVRRKVYAQAESKGQPPAPRNVSPSVAQGGNGKPEGPPPSVFVSESLHFREMAAGRQSGLIPRLLEESLWLLFWKRLPDGRIVGCQLETEELRTRLLGLLPPAATPERILTLLDERGEPLFAPAEYGSSRDYRRPFVAREVSELLPRWEAAAYLTDPTLVAARARLAGLILWTLVALLTVSIAGGGTLVLRALTAEVRLARQKSSFVANVSHELKTPLTSIRMYAEMLQEGRLRDPVRRRQYLGTIVEESRRLTRLVNRVLDFARLEQGRRRYAFGAAGSGVTLPWGAGHRDGRAWSRRASQWAFRPGAGSGRRAGGKCVGTRRRWPRSC